MFKPQSKKRFFINLFTALSLALSSLVLPAPSFATGTPMTLTYDLFDGQTYIEFPLRGTVNVTVDWGDGSSSTYTNPVNASHNYASPGEYTISIDGTLTQFGDGWAWYHNMHYLKKIGSFGDIGLTSLHGAFVGAQRLVDIPASLPSTVTDTSMMFGLSTNLDTDLASWNMSNVTNMSHMFRENSQFNSSSITGWNVSNVTDFSFMFYYANSFNQDLSAWNTSSATNMESMFQNAGSFNEDVTTWDLNGVTTTEGMFQNTPFNQDISGWDVSTVTNMARMFQSSSFNQDISTWNVSSVTSFFSMFHAATSFNQPLNSWNVSSGVYFEDMFRSAHSFNQPLNSWNVSNAITMKSMFFDSYLFDQDLNNWDVSSVTNFEWMFGYTRVFDGNISTWDVSAATNMAYMFYGSQAFNSDITGWQTTSLTWMVEMFRSAAVFNQDISSWNVSNVTNLYGVFAWTNNFNQDISTWDVSNVTVLEQLFYGAQAFNQDLSAWDTSSVTNFMRVFSETPVYNYSVEDWDTSAGTNMHAMFMGAQAFNQPIVKNATPGSWNTANVSDFSFMFANTSVFNQDISSWDTSGAVVMNNMFQNAQAFNTEIQQTVGGWNPLNVTNFSDMFRNAPVYNKSVASWNTASAVYLNWMFADTPEYNQPMPSSLGHWNTSNVQQMIGTFWNTQKFNQDLSTWDVGNVQYFINTFGYARLFDGDVTNWNTSSAVNMEGMFRDAAVFNQDISGWDVSNVNHFGLMFQAATLFNQPIGSWDTSSANYMYSMFSSTQDFNQPIGNWDVSNVSQFQDMFRYTSSFNQDLTGWVTTNAQHMHSMFAYSAFNGDVSNFDLNGVGDTSSMFSYSPFNQDISGWDVSTVGNMTAMFAGASDFNQPIDDWDVSNVYYFNRMFSGASDFNQPIYKWNVSHGGEFGNMFEGATNFNQDISTWDLNEAYYFEGFIYNSGMSKAHYSKILDNFSQNNVHNNRSIWSTQQYLCSAQTARDHLVNDKFWYVGDFGVYDCLTEQTIDFPQPEDFAVNKSRILTGSATSGLDLSFMWISGPCEVEGNLVTATAQGVCVVAANQTGNDEYSDAPQKVRWINILKPADPDVLYFENGATSGTAPVDNGNPHVAGDLVTIKPNSNLQKTDALFIGWNTEPDGTGTHYDENEVINMPSNDLILYAEWFSLIPHTVSFDGNGADSGTPPSSSTLMQTETLTIPDNSDLVKEHFSFIGWATEEDGGGDFYEPGDTFTMGANDVVLYAQWQEDPKYSVTYSDYGADSGSAPSDPETYYSGQSAYVLNHDSLTKEGHSFIGWSTEQNGGGDFYQPGDFITLTNDHVVLYPVWFEDSRFSVVYDGNGSTAGSTPDDPTRYLEGDVVTVLDEGTLAWHGHTFVGWNTEEDGSGDWYEPGETFAHPAVDVTLFAIWDEDAQFSLSYSDENASSGSAPATSTAYVGDVLNVEACTLIRKGFECIGWNTEIDGSGDSYETGDHFTIVEENTTLYPMWRATIVTKNLAISFNKHVHTLTDANIKILKKFYKKFLKGKTSSSVVTVVGFIQHDKATVAGKQLPTPVVKHNKWLQKARAKAIVAYLKSLGAKVTFKIKISKVNTAKASSRAARITAVLQS